MRDNWTETTLGDVAEVNMGQSPPGHTYNTEGIGMPFMQGSAEFGEHFPEPVKFCSAPAKIAEVGDLLLSVRAPVGDTNFANQRIAIGRGLATVRASAVSLTEFLRLVIQLNTAGLLATSGTGMFSSITGKNLKEFMILVPPIAEQKRIVDVVSSVDAYIDALQQQVDAARTARDAVGEDAVNSGYPVAKLSDIGRVVTGSTPPTKRLDYWEPEEVDFVTAGDFGAQLLIMTASRKVSRAGANVSRLLSSHSVMQVCIGATIGKVGYVSHEVVTNQQINSIVGLEELDAYFVALMLSTNEMQATIRDRAGTTTLPIISKSGWGELAIPWPDISVRESISVLAKSIDEFISETDKAVVEAKNLRSGLLSDLLSGEHEIPVSYDDLLGAA